MARVEVPFELYDKLDEYLMDNFEDAIVPTFGKFILDEELDQGTYKNLAQDYLKARQAYLDAIAACIMYPESFDYVEFSVP